MPKGVKGKGGRRNVGQLKKNVQGLHATAWQDYARQTSHNAHSKDARNIEHLDTRSDTRGLLSIPDVEGANVIAIDMLAAQVSPQERSPGSQEARYQQSSGKGPESVSTFISEDAKCELDINQKGYGDNKMPQRGTAKMKFGNSSEADDFTFERTLNANEGLRVAGGNPSDTDTMGFFVDLAGSESPVKTGFPHPTVISAPSPLTDPETDDEVIVFSGRRRRKEDVSETSIVTKSSFPRHNNGAVIPKPSKPTVIPFRKSPSRSEVSMVLKGSQSSKSQAKGKHRGNKYERMSRKHIEDDEILADYIANLQASDGANEFIGITPLEQRDSISEGQEPENHLNFEENEERRDSYGSWDSADLKDFDGFSTSSEPMTVTPRILAKRLRNSVVQYLVIRRGDPVDEARWLPLKSIKAIDAADAIASFEYKELVDIERLNEDEDGSDESSAFESLIAMDLAEDAMTLKDEKDLEDRQRARMSDEQIARLLSKQAELGIIGDDLVLLDADVPGTGSSGDWRVGGLENPRAKSSHFSLKLKNQKKNRSQNRYSSKNLFADVLEQDSYHDFDIMDQERPSLRKKPKRRGQAEMDFHSSDPELQYALNLAWENDRTKKKQRKQDREELRAQGILSKKSKPDLKAKYIEGLSVDDVKSEIKAFLMTSSESQPLPPMGHNERKAVHDIANKAGLKSKSVGTGLTRFPVLYKTSRTKALTPDLDARIDAMFTPKRFLPRLDKSRKKTAPPVKIRRGGLNATASYRDGEVVGVGAPELGIENKGRAMLEKMGWSTGTALGAVDNKGIAQPIAQIVKTSKAGLG